ncbi:MAG: alpha-amylase [Candidatus Kapabacteria bacterium]|nr:alpha-amylase [Candidatus Kapabacteria bacterium]
MKPALERLRDELARLDRFPPTPYRVPGAWVGDESYRMEASAARYFLGVLDEILAMPPVEVQRTSSTGVIYNALVRHVTSYDHGPDARRVGWRTTGTFLKMIAILPYLRSINIGTILLLPINELGSVGQKGTHGSPYSVRNPFAIEPGLSEPLIELTAQEQAQAFVEAAHRMGMKVITEVVLRTASLDSALAEDHPEWFYWIHADKADTFAAPVFSEIQCADIIAQVERGSRSQLPEPSLEYQRQFAGTPIQRHCDSSGWIGTMADGQFVRIPGAFADWPPDDPQPAWSDVTYLRLHHHPDFPYMAYNTIRMFDERLDSADMENTGLWNMIAAIIPTQMRTLGTDGAMIDMGHALPSSLRQRIISEARQQNPDAVMIEENFHLDTASARDGFTIVTGYLPFDGYSADGLRRFVDRIAASDVPIGFMGWGESHNTPRLASRIDQRACASVWMFMSLFPKSAPCIAAGMELGETRPMNTGLGFTQEQIAQWPATELALFSDVPLDWDGGVENLAQFRSALSRRQSHDIVRYFTDEDRVDALKCDHDAIVAFHRQAHGSSRGLVVLLNLSSETLHVCVDLQHTNIRAIAVEPRCSMQGKMLWCDVPAYAICYVPTHCVGNGS